jgi:hypothetical protein
VGNRHFEIVDNDEDVVHSFKRHIPPCLASPAGSSFRRK